MDKFTLSPSNKYKIIETFRKKLNGCHNNKIFIVDLQKNEEISHFFTKLHKLPFGFFMKDNREWLWGICDDKAFFIDLDLRIIYENKFSNGDYLIWRKMYPNSDGNLLAIKGYNFTSSELRFYDFSDPSNLKQLNIDNAHIIEVFRAHPKWTTNKVKILEPEHKFEKINDGFYVSREPYHTDELYDELILEKHGDTMKII